MQKRTLGLTLMIAALLLQGCSASPDVTPSQTDQRQIQSVPDGSSAQQEVPTSVPTKDQLTPEDLEAYGNATMDNDMAECESITDEAFKEQCKKTVEETKDLREQEEKERQQQEEERDENDALLEEIVLSENHARCGELTLPNYVIDCEVNILANMALESNDRSICEKASVDAQEGCFFQFDNSQLGPAPQN